jgi:small-conductance mechanosensitive channel
MRFLFLIIFSLLFANDKNITENNSTIILKQIKNISNTLLKNEFYINYQNYLRYKNLKEKLKKYERLARYNKKYNEKLLSIKTELELLKENENIFKSLIKIKELPPPPQINNPFSIISAFTYEKEIKSIVKQNEEYYKEFQNTLRKLYQLNELYKKQHKKDKTLQKLITDFETINNVYKTKLSTLKTQASIYIQQVNLQIQKEITKLIYLAISIAISILIFMFIKLAVRKYVKDESVYIVNKILNFINITVIILIISFFYINNATYLITILGFASAGIAIAMKDWFMNIFGWFVIMTSGNFKVGDRIRIELQNGNVKIIGDVIDITLTKIVLYEDVTLTTYKYNRRAGRIVFVPNNVVFNTPVFNYTHNGLTTVWDGIDITITFDSNYKKAVYLAKEIVSKYSKGHTDITKRRIKKLKAVYHIKNANVEPRVYTFIEENGIRISCWYLAPFVTLNMRSQISAEIIDAFNKQEDIKIAYPTYNINGKIKMEEENG